MLEYLKSARRLQDANIKYTVNVLSFYNYISLKYNFKNIKDINKHKNAVIFRFPLYCHKNNM